MLQPTIQTHLISFCKLALTPLTYNNYRSHNHSLSHIKYSSKELPLLASLLSLAGWALKLSPAVSQHAARTFCQDRKTSDTKLHQGEPVSSCQLIVFKNSWGEQGWNTLQKRHIGSHACFTSVLSSRYCGENYGMILSAILLDALTPLIWNATLYTDCENSLASHVFTRKNSCLSIM